jgi:hypothetical protein
MTEGDFLEFCGWSVILKRRSGPKDRPFSLVRNISYAGQWPLDMTVPLAFFLTQS